MAQETNEKEFSFASVLARSFECGGKKLDNEEIGLVKPSIRQQL